MHVCPHTVRLLLLPAEIRVEERPCYVTETRQPPVKEQVTWESIEVAVTRLETVAVMEAQWMVLETGSWKYRVGWRGDYAIGTPLLKVALIEVSETMSTESE